MCMNYTRHSFSRRAQRPMDGSGQGRSPWKAFGGGPSGRGHSCSRGPHRFSPRCRGHRHPVGSRAPIHSPHWRVRSTRPDPGPGCASRGGSAGAAAQPTSGLCQAPQVTAPGGRGGIQGLISRSTPRREAEQAGMAGAQTPASKRLSPPLTTPPGP